MVADYADDKVIWSISDNPVTASSNLQLHLNLMTNWCDKWRIKINQNKSSHLIYSQEGSMSNCYIKQHYCSNIGHNKIPGSQSRQTTNMEKSYTNQKTDSQRPYAHAQPSYIKN